MEKWAIGIISVLAVIGVVLLVASKSNEQPVLDDQYEIEENLGALGSDATIDDGQTANINEQIDQINLNRERQMNNNTETKQLTKPELTIDVNKTHIATLETDKGNIVIELDARNTPITANNFVYLANNNFYDNTIFHRVIKEFMIQGGDPTGTGTGSPGYRFDDEPITGSYTRGTIAMANSGKNTNGSQFFIMHQDYPLPKNYVIFGKVVEGMDVVDAIATSEVKTSPTGEMSSPVEAVVVKNVVIAVQ